MKKIYVTYDWKYLRPTARYSLGFFINNDAESFVTENFPSYTKDDYKGIYSLTIDELLDDAYYNDGVTKRFATVEYDDLSKTEAQLLAGMTDVFTFLGIELISNQSNARKRLDDNTKLTKINNTTYELYPEHRLGELDETTPLVPAAYLYL